jgi:hypothetical protein
MTTHEINQTLHYQLGYEEVEDSGVYAHYKTDEASLLPDYCSSYGELRKVIASMAPSEYVDLQRLLAESVANLGLRFVLELPLEVIAQHVAEIYGGIYND